MAALEELESAYAKGEDAIQRFRPSWRSACELCRPADAALFFAQRLTRASGRREDLSEARRPAAHRRAQDQQLPRAGAAGASAWARSASSPRPAQDSMAWRRRLSARCSGLNASCTWATEDMRRQELNVFRMRLLGAEVRGVSNPASRTLKDAINEAMRDWVTNVAHHALPAGSGAGRASVSARWCAIFIASSARSARADPEGGRQTAGCASSPAWAVARMRSGYFTSSSGIRRRN